MWRKILAVLIGLFFLSQIVLAQGGVVYLPLIFKGDCMANWAKLEISDGTTTVNLIAKGTGFHLTEWNPQIIQPKEGGVFQDSPLAAGRRLVFAVDATAVETFELDVNDNDQDGLITQSQDLMRLLLKARAYQSTEFQDGPVWVRARSACETNDRHALVINWIIPQLDNPYGPPFFSATELAAMEDLSLQIERGHWLALAPGESEGVEISNSQTWDYRLTLSQVSTTPTAIVTEFARHSGGNIYATSLENRIMRSTDDGATWSNNLTGAPLGTTTDLYCIYALANDYILAGGSQGNGSPLIRTTNNGTSWSDVSIASMERIMAIGQLVNGNVIAVGQSTTGAVGAIWRSTDNGANWTLVQDNAIPAGYFSSVVQADNGHVLASGSSGVTWRSTDNGATWGYLQQIANGEVIDIKKIFLGSNGYLYAICRTNNAATYSSQIWQSTDNGATWNRILVSPPWFLFQNVIETGTTGEFYAVVHYSATSPSTSFLWRSLDYGVSWQIMSTVNTSTTWFDFVRFGLLQVPAGNLIIGTGNSTVAGQIHRTGTPSTIGLGQTATTGAEALVSNRGNLANITHIFQDDGGVFTSIYPATLPLTLFPSLPANNDALYFGIESSNISGGPFANLVFNLTTAMSGVRTINWEYWNGAAWSALTVFDNTNQFGSTGVRSVHWLPPVNWASTSVNSVTALWVRARLSGLAGTITRPVQATRNIYTTVLPYVDIDAAQIRGDISAIARIKAFNVSDNSGPGGSALTYSNRIVVGLRSLDRGTGFVAHLNMSDEQNQTGILVITGANTSFADDIATPTGRRAAYNPGGVEAMATRITVQIGASVARDFYGTFHVFLRARRTGGAVTDLTTRLQVATGSGGITFTAQAKQLQTTTAFEVVDFGAITLPVSGSFKSADLGDVTEIRIQASAASGTPDLYLYDLIMIPVDEWAGDFVDVANTSNSDVGRSNGIAKMLDIDSVADPRNDIRSLVRIADSTGLITAEYNPINNGPAILQTNTQQRLWFFAMQTSATGSSYSWLAPPEIAHSVQVFKNERYLGLRGER